MGYFNLQEIKSLFFINTFNANYDNVVQENFPNNFIWIEDFQSKWEINLNE